MSKGRARLIIAKYRINSQGRERKVYGRLAMKNNKFIYIYNKYNLTITFFKYLTIIYPYINSNPYGTCMQTRNRYLNDKKTKV